MEDVIYISFPIIEKGVNALPDSSDLEKAVRSMLYHETSHAILTPKNLISKWDDHIMRSIFNIFEDERIETLLANFYMNVDFKAQLYNICGSPKPPRDAQSAFFNIVRYRVGPDHFVNKVDEIITKYRTINSTTDRCYYYKDDVEKLYEQIAKMFKKTPAIFTPPMDIKITGDNGEEGKGKGSSSEGAQSAKVGNTDNMDESAHGEEGLTAEQISKLLEEVFKPAASLSARKREQVEKFEKALDVLFANFNKKTSGGNGINTYSGVFNPRAVVRKDYRYFERSISSNGNNKFGSIHLNLVLDRSGSFVYNQNETNAILAILSNFERKNKNFTMDVFFIGEEMTKAKTLKDRIMDCSGGNTIPDYAAEMFIRAQKPNTFNYNIVLFDGDALSDCYGENFAQKAKRFKTFDRKQTFLITDSDNERYLKKRPYTSAKVIVTNNYNEELIKNITRAFKTMLS